MSHAQFVPLRLFSAYTMLEGAIDPKAIATKARDLGFPAAAICDRNGLYGVMPFSDAARKAGVQPIIGTLLAVARPDRPQGAPAMLDWLALYAQDAVGYDNLCALVSAAHLDRPVELDAHAAVARRGELGGRARQPGTAEILDARDHARREQLEGALDEQLLHEGIAHLDARALGRARASAYPHLADPRHRNRGRVDRHRDRGFPRRG